MPLSGCYDMLEFERSVDPEQEVSSSCSFSTVSVVIWTAEGTPPSCVIESFNGTAAQLSADGAETPIRRCMSRTLLIERADCR